MKRVLDPGGQLAMADLFQFLWISWLSFSFSLLLVFLGNLGLCQRYQACAAGPCTVGQRPPRAGKGLRVRLGTQGLRASELSTDPGPRSTRCLSAQVPRPTSV